MDNIHLNFSNIIDVFDNFTYPSNIDTIAKNVALGIYEFSTFFNAAYCLTLIFAIKSQGKNTTLPTTYIYNMSFSTILLVTIGFLLYIVPSYFSNSFYEAYRNTIGPQLSLLVSFFYFHPMLTLLLMTVNRIAVVISMHASKLFTANKIWLYTLIHMSLNFMFLFIPYISECQINFDLRLPTFASACSPKRHTITSIFNEYSLFFPFIAFFFNSLVIINFKLQRSSICIKLKRIFKKDSHHSTAQSIPKDVLKAKKKTERMLIIQSFATAFYLSMYELTSLLLRIYSADFLKLSLDWKLAITFLRLAQIPCQVFLVYFILTPVTRKLYIKFLREKIFRLPPKTITKVSTTVTNNKAKSA